MWPNSPRPCWFWDREVNLELIVSGMKKPGIMGYFAFFQKFGASHSCLSSHYISEINLSNDTISITIVNANHQNGHRMYEITDCASYKFVQVAGHKQVKVCVSQPQKMWI